MSFKQSLVGRIAAKKGATFAIQKTLTSSGITTAATNLFTASTTPLYVEDIIVETDATGLAGGTNFQLAKSSGALGQANVFVETVANLGANKTFNLQNPKTQASVTSQPCTLAAGDSLQYNSTVGACTGAGQIRITVIFRYLADGPMFPVS